jgi:hypothetical protein
MTLPKPDEFGHYWLSAERGTIIFRSSGCKEKSYILLITSDDGFMFDGTKLKRFATAQSAAKAWCEWHDKQECGK